MILNVHIINWILRGVFKTFCHINADELEKIPKCGSLIIVANHINFLEVPVFIPYFDNPLVTGLAKQETWQNPLFKFLFNKWEIIPINRGAVDREAFCRSLEALEKGRILAIAPEGTRSKHGRMQKGKSGIVALALRSNAPIIPIGFYGHERIWDNLKHLKRTDFNIVVGKPFRLDIKEGTPSRDIRQQATDEIMYKIAELLPEYYRGNYQFENEVDYKYAFSF